MRFWRGLTGDRAAVLSPPSAAERAMAESDEYWSYLMAGAYALVGEADQALSWLEHAVKVRGWVDYVYFTRHDRFLESLRPDPRFQELMAFARERYARFTDDGTPLRRNRKYRDPHVTRPNKSATMPMSTWGRRRVILAMAAIPALVGDVRAQAASESVALQWSLVPPILPPAPGSRWSPAIRRCPA